MEIRFYETQELDLLSIAQALETEYKGHGFDAQHLGNPEEVMVQLKKESVLRHVTGLDRVVGVTLKHANGGTLVKVGTTKWTDQVAVAAVGMLVLFPLAITAAGGAITQGHVIHDILTSVDNQIRQQQPGVQLGTAPEQD